VTDTKQRPLFSAARWSTLRLLLDELTDAGVDRRESRLAEIAAADSELAVALRELLADSGDPGTRAPERVMQRLSSDAGDDTPLRIGPFRLLHRIGAGGMGVIYLAEREQVDFVQQVALKLLDGGSARLARLAARERRILSALTHPNITAFVDAGSIDGRAWMAMEYVDGEALLDYCRRNRCDIRERIRLFDQVCSAVLHAHAQLVIHRDLKPSNILVNREGTAKLLDFGIALVLDPGEESEPATRVFTPEYAAPEQLRGERASTATDIYALGLVLYELVAGHRLPTLDRGGGEREWSATELARYAATREPTRAVADPLPMDPMMMRKLLRGDLGRIIAHALNASPDQRYASVAQLRDDLARWLDFRPLGIGRPSLGYLSRRFVQRHRLATVLAGLGLFGILLLGSVAAWQARAKSIEAERARAALRQSEATRDFMASIFFSTDPLQGRGMQVTAGDLLIAARHRIDTQLANQPDIAAELLYQIGNVYVSAGDDAAVRETLGKALAFNAQRADPSVALEGSAKVRLAYLDYVSKHERADLIGIEASLAKLRAAGVAARSGLADALGMYGNVLYNEGRNDEAVAAESESAQIFDTLGEANRSDYLTALLALSDLFASLDRHREALDTADRALADPMLGADDAKELRNELLGARARGLSGLHRYGEAETTMSQVIAEGSRSLGYEHASIRYWRYRRVQVLDLLGRLDEAHVEIGRLLAIPALGNEQPIARAAHLVTRLGIDIERRATEATADPGPTLTVACGKDGNAVFCAKARLLAAELAIRVKPHEAAVAALAVCAADEAIAKDAGLRRRLILLRARQARLDGDVASSGALLAGLRSESDLPEDVVAQLDLEGGLLALDEHRHAQAIEALEKARQRLATHLSQSTPVIDEIESALAMARKGR